MATNEDYMVLGFDTRDPAQKEELVKHLADARRAGQTMKEALQMPEYQLEQLYALAYGKYQQGDYAGARDTFQYLLLFDELDYRFLLGHAASLDKLGETEGAARGYQLATFADPYDPVAFYHAATCLIKLGEVDQALVGLEMVIANSAKDPKYAELKERAQLMKENLEQRD